jgi:serine/threonine protein kinase
MQAGRLNPVVASLIGRNLGKYEIIELLGQGGMATVYKGFQPDIERYVAVKVLPPHPGQDRQFMDRFRLEARTIARLQHPHILPLYDYGADDDILYLVMAYIEGGSLSDRISQGPMPLLEVEKILRQVASAMDYAHRQGIIHRDIKPDNILMDREGHALLADFGIVKIIEGENRLTMTGGLVGTPAYMSPEQCQGLPVMNSADIYSLGVVVYEMITGRQPFVADTPMQVALRHMTDPVPNIGQVIDGLPEALSPVMSRVMAKDPLDRYETATEFATAFSKAIHTDDSFAEIRLQYGLNSTREINAMRHDYLKAFGRNPIFPLSSFVVFVALLILSLSSLNKAALSPAAVDVPANDIAEVASFSPAVRVEGSVGRLSFGTANALGDSVNLRVENLAAPAGGYTYVVWLENTMDRSALSLGELTLDALGSGALSYTDAEGRMLPTLYNAVIITEEQRTNSAGYRIRGDEATEQSQIEGRVVYSGSVPVGLTEALNQILNSAEDGISGESLIDSALTEANVALENGGDKAELDNLGGLYTRAELVLNTLLGGQEDYNGNGRAENPGRGQGVIRFLDRIEENLNTVLASSEVDLRLQSDAELIRTCVANSRTRINRIIELQESLLGVGSIEEATPQAEDSAALLEALVNGADVNENGRVEPFAGECGLQQIPTFGILVGSMDIMTGPLENQA